MAQIYISLGSNVEREYHIHQGLNALSRHFGKLTISSLFESDAVGFDGAAFYNLVVGVQTSWSVNAVAECLRAIEFAFGRPAQATKFSPRTLDLDLLLYGDLVIDEPLQLPRDEITTNAFVLWPLAELAPNALHPVINLSYQQLWQAYDQTSQQLRKVPLTWQAAYDID